MIVRDEAHVVTETLACVVPHIDTWVVVDTGSTDGTPDVISSFFAARGIAGELHHRPWVNFGVNRTEALELCKNKADFVWVIDADDLVVGSLDITNLTLDSYLLKFGSDFRYWRKQIFRCSLRWKYEGVLHEYPVCLDPDSTEGRLEGDYYIESRRLGSRSQSANKYARDAQILLDVITQNPDDTRSTFYLAQSYRDAGKPEEALKYYRRRAEMGGWEEEVFYSLLQCGECLERAGEPWESALNAYLTSWQSRPQRAEPLYRIAKHYRRRREYDLAHLFASRAREIPMPAHDNLFVSAEIYDWQIDDELAISSYYLGRYQESFDLCHRLLNLPSLPEPDRERINANRDFAANHLKDAESGYPETIVRRLVESRSNATRDSARIVFTITSCRRYGLFQKTVNSFLNCCLDLDLVDRWICIDDGSSDEDRRLMRDRYPFFEFIFKDRPNKGHARSMNMLLDVVESPYWLHLEDDWQFFVKDRYLEKALAILDDDPGIGQVLFNRNYGETIECRDIVGGSVGHTARERIRYRLHEHLHKDTEAYERYMQELPAGARSNVWWPHYSLRPSLLRMSAIRDVGRYRENSGHFELDFAERYTARGYRAAFLDSINCLHIGRLTWEGSDVPNAYDLNDEQEFGRPVRKPHRIRLLANWTSSEHLCEVWNRQSRGNRRWNYIEVTSDPNDADYWAIINFPNDSSESFDKRRTVVFQMEPRRGVAAWGAWARPDPREFLQVRSHHQFRNNSEWHLDLSYNQLLSAEIEKTRDLSCVTSSKTSDPGQELRIAFLKYLERQGAAIDIFGYDNLHEFHNYRGPLPEYNKNDGILPYRYTIAVENHSEINYFTEKIVDAILGECLCFYWGCPNLEHYIDSDAFIRLPLEDFARSREIVESAIRNNEHARRLEPIRRAKRRLLEEYQFFPTMSHVISGHKIVERLQVKVINLDRRSDRWQSLRENVNETVGHDFFERCERVVAVDGTSLVMDSSIAALFRGNDFDYRRGIVACALSHLSIWKDLLKIEDGICLILEDDVRFCEGFYGQLVEACGWLDVGRKDFDLVLLGYQCWPEHAFEDSVQHQASQLFPMEWHRYLGGTYAYLISSTGARRLLELVDAFGIQNGIDWFIMGKAQHLNVLQCVPHIVTTTLAVPGTSTDSDIQHEFTSLTSRNQAEEVSALRHRKRASPPGSEKLPKSLHSFLAAQLRHNPLTWPEGIGIDEIEGFIAFTDDCGIQPWLYHLMRSSPVAVGYPRRVLEAFEQRNLMETISAKLRTDEASWLLARFSEAKIRALVLKGTALGNLVYPHPGRRPACDVDIFVDAGRISDAEAILEGRGYHPSVRYSQQVTYRRAAGPAIVHNIDLHLEISEAKVFSRAFTFEEVYSRSISLVALGDKARTLCPVDSLLHACMHLAQHREWGRLIWLCDIDLLARDLSEEDAGEFVRLARQKRMAAVCAKGLQMALSTFDSQWRSEKLQAFARRSHTVEQLAEPSAHYLAGKNLLAHDFLLLMRSGSPTERRQLLSRIVLNPWQIRRLADFHPPGYLKPFVKAYRSLTTAVMRWLGNDQFGSSNDNV
jgi:GR25 family glycosyltransferase involved in LPS biosynthesis/glycosyltransferase involved in cell wall biosynthesis